ncbi:hypothetical protein EYF80_064927 [Liparis tanakae]|uniref:Uncharacterized protein n=1 Tax=Liparis tanakae TaxID=230148 RepID=A0A4Z2E819_9TELE|nr:hypothetical protein EYF80_064927 [Liparis tanakae]
MSWCWPPRMTSRRWTCRLWWPCSRSPG